MFPKERPRVLDIDRLGESSETSINLIPYFAASGTATSAAAGDQAAVHKLECIPKRIMIVLCSSLGPTSVADRIHDERGQIELDGHDRDKREPPDGEGEVLIDAKEIEPRRDDLKDDQTDN